MLTVSAGTTAARPPSRCAHPPRCQDCWRRHLGHLALGKQEPQHVFDLYGPDARKPGTYASNCLLARRLLERDVRFVQLYHRGWDQHNDLPRDLALATVLAAASPVAVGAGPLCRGFGLPERPAIWAALGGLALGPALLPAVTVSTIEHGQTVPIAIHTLAERAALLGALPGALAFLFRRTMPHAASALAPDLRGVAVASLCLLAVCAGGAAAHTDW